MAKIKWEVVPADESAVKRLEYGLGISRLTARVLTARGIASEPAPGRAHRFARE